MATETHYGLISLSPVDEADPNRLLALQRNYGGIENGLHYRRDMTLSEARCRSKIGRTARTMATLNNLAQALILSENYDYLPQARRRYATHMLEAL